MKIQVEELKHAGFRIEDELVHEDLIPFVQRLIKKPLWVSRLYWASNLLFLMLLIGLGFWKIKYGNMAAADVILPAVTGIGLSLLLVPVHEALHAIAYKMVGAPLVSFDAQWKKLVFMAVAHRFVASRNEFIVVALAPFLVISLVLGPLAIVLGGGSDMFFLGMVLAHASMCSGDFALLAYFELHNGKELVSYDDRYLKKSWFLVR